MTPQQRRDKWREEAENLLRKLGYNEPMTDKQIYTAIGFWQQHLNYLIIEYINVKHAEDEKDI